MIKMRIEIDVSNVIVGWVLIEGIAEWDCTEGLSQRMDERGREALANADQPESESLRESVRAMLRHHGYKASGRSKPAQEYLMRCLREDGRLPTIYPAVDVLNATSASMGIPISMLKWSEFPTQTVWIRLGKIEDSYVFNSVGQTLDLKDLVAICGGFSGEVALGSPIKDSVRGKITREDRDALCILYGPRTHLKEEQMMTIAQGFAEDLKKWTGCERISFGTQSC